MIGRDPLMFWGRKTAAGAAFFAPEALADYRACWTPETIHASCEDYRAAASIDIVHDDADAGRKVDCPTLVLWGSEGVIATNFDALALWRQRAADVRGCALEGGHYLAEECPEAVLAELLPFLADASGD
jgi:haloacetate dehalogenase